MSNFLVLSNGYEKDWVNDQFHHRCENIAACKQKFLESYYTHFSLSSGVCYDEKEWRHLFQWLIFQIRNGKVIPPSFWRVYYGKPSFRAMVRFYMKNAHEQYQKRWLKELLHEIKTPDKIGV